jgi:oxygen-dependent protoporphyrinogen oxidase
VVIVGGGISGLAAAHRITEIAEARGLPLQATVLEAAGRLGGAIATRSRDGFLLEEGPDAILTEKPWAVDLARRLGIEKRIVGTIPDYRRSFVVRAGRLHPTPEGFYLLAPSKLGPMVRTPIFSLLGKARMACDLFLPRRRKQTDESLAGFVRRRLGREALERMAQPMIAGIYGADPEKLSLLATFPRFHKLEAEHGSVIRGLLANARRQQRAAGAGASPSGASGPRYSLFVSFDGGLQVLIDALVARLPAETCRTGTTVDAIYPAVGGGWRLRCQGREEHADAIILAAPTHRAAELIGPFDARLGKRLGEIRYGYAATVCLAYRANQIEHPMDGAGFVLPAIERFQMLGCTFGHRKFPGRVPDGHVLLRAFHGESAREVSDDDLVEATHRELDRLLTIRGKPLFSQIARWPHSMPHYEVGHLERVDAIWEALSAHRAIGLAGNGYRGIGLPDCVRSGEQAAEAVVERILAS